MWPSTKNQQFWGSAAEFVELRGRGKMRRSGKCCSSYTVYTVYTLCINLGINSVACLSLRGNEWDDFYFCTGTACRTRATVGLAKQFGTPLQALQYFQKPIEDRPEKPSSVRLHRRAVSTQTMPDSDPMETCLLTLPESERLPALTKLLQVVSARSSTDVPVTIPDDFLTLKLRAMTVV